MKRKSKQIKRVRFSKQRRKTKKVALKSILLNGTPSRQARLEELNLDAMPNLDKKTTVMGVIYAKWCPHCKDLIPDENDATSPPRWKQMIDIIKQTPNRKNDAYYLQIEEDEIRNHGKLDKLNKECSGICKTPVTASGYPTVFKMRGGRLNMYNGVREAQAMASWFLS